MGKELSTHTDCNYKPNFIGFSGHITTQIHLILLSTGEGGAEQIKASVEGENLFCENLSQHCKAKEMKGRLMEVDDSH